MNNINYVKYKGSADDVEGLATGSSVGNALNWTYDIYLDIKGSNLKVKFNDWIYKQDNNIAINRAYVSKFGIDIGSVTLVFLRGKTCLLYTSPSPRDQRGSRMPSSA